jgi:chromosome segregation protein
MAATINVFENGATWLRADFHLHTKADAEFVYKDDPSFFATKYIDQLVAQEIKIGVITNHNKFDLIEFKELHKNALKKDIYLLPGLEFSVKDGAKGLHVLLVFDTSWVINTDNHNHIQDFITSAFIGCVGFDRPPYNKNSTFTFEEMCKHLEKFGLDYFIIMAHVDDSSGLFYELDARGLEGFLSSDSCKERVLAFQKARNRDNLKKVKHKIPALVEGTDSAHNGIEDIGLGNKINGITQKTFVKTGAYNFEALKYALQDSENRVVTGANKPFINKAYLKSITFNTTKWKDRKIPFNSGMNNFIGIRGGGKSTLIETVRYALDIPIGNNSHEPKYKEKLVQNFIGSGGKIEVEIIDKHGTTFIAERIYGETPQVYEIMKDGSRELKHNLKINALINKPLYYGQKDLSDIGGVTSTEDLIDKLMGDKLLAVKQDIKEQNNKVVLLIADIKKVDGQLAKKEEIEAKKAAIEKDIKVFKELEIDKKLNKQIEFNKDANKLESIIAFEQIIINEVETILKENTASFNSHIAYESKQNADLFTKVYASFTKFQTAFLQLSVIINELQLEKANMLAFQTEFNAQYEALKEEFSEIKRTINLPNIEADTYVKLSKDYDLQVALLKEIENLSTRKEQLRTNLLQALVDLKKLWHKEFEITKEEIEKINAQQIAIAKEGIPAIKIEITFKGNGAKFYDFLADKCRGSGLREAHYDQITEYADLIEVYNDFKIEGSPINKILAGGNNLHNFRQKFLENINEFLTYRVPDKFTIFYKGRPLGEHSLGQRASALIIFILTLKENDLIVIDQPEDDLDNQTIYLDVIAQLKKTKDKTQFIFATHNPNIPVLGDCEQIVSCSFNKDSVETEIGSIDNKNIQKRIVDIMEGGDKAFNRRKMIYELWKH